MIENLIIGILVGSFLVGTSVQRTLTVGTGEFAKTFISSCINSIFYFLTVYFISKDNIVAYIGTAIGACIITTGMSFKNYRRQKHGHRRETNMGR